MNLSREDIAILRALSESSGYATGPLSRMIEGNRGHKYSARTRQRCLALQKDGLLAPLDDKKPIIWCRTEAGSSVIAALARRNGVVRWE